MTIDLPKVASFAMSAASAGVSAYVWVQQQRANQPRVNCDLIDWGIPAVHIGTTDRTIRYFLSFRAILSNLSLQPNALLKAEFALLDRNRAWVSGRPDPKPRTPPTAFPINLPPQTTAPLDAVQCFELVRSTAEADQQLGDRAYLLKIAAAPLTVRVTLTGLGGRLFHHDLRL